MRNDFNQDEIARWFSHHNHECWWCGKSHANCFHHILGRETNHILSAAPLNNFACHINIHGILRKKENQKILLKKTLRYLLSQGYELSAERDGEFLQKYGEFYS